MTSITASMNIKRRGAIRSRLAALKILPPAIPNDTTSIGKGAMGDSAVASRTERVMAAYQATLRPLTYSGSQFRV